jgi:recombination protein RecT
MLSSQQTFGYYSLKGAIMASATEALKEQAGIVKKPPTINDKLEAMTPQIAAALPRHLNAERMIRIGLTCMKTNPDLLECSMQSVMASIMIAAQLGLEPGVLGQCFLIPYKGTCTLVPGWMGLIDMVNRAGKAAAWTGAVYAGDEFDWALGDKPFVTHRPSGNETALTHVYAIARVKGMEFPIVEVWSMQKIIAHRDKYNKVGGRHYSYKHMEMYGRKVALLQVLKYVPRSIELATAFSLDASAEMGTQHLEIKDVPSVIEGSFITPEEPNRLPENVESSNNGSPKLDKDEQKQPDVKPEPFLCSSCRKMIKPDGMGHADDCEYKAKAEQDRLTSKPPNAALYSVKAVEQKTKKAKKSGEPGEPYLTLAVVNQAGQDGKLYVWHKSLFDYFAVGSYPKTMLAEISEQKTKDDRVFYNVEHLLELGGVKFVNDKPAGEQAAMSADEAVEQELFGDSQ